ncbi:MAG: hypothetical protein SNF33_02480 [Candidatus Algichlamydia australiensis]|nr:hypothetical protein [Chlamydiales bacterium]
MSSSLGIMAVRMAAENATSLGGQTLSYAASSAKDKISEKEWSKGDFIFLGFTATFAYRAYISEKRTDKAYWVTAAVATLYIWSKYEWGNQLKQMKENIAEQKEQLECQKTITQNLKNHQRVSEIQLKAREQLQKEAISGREAEAKARKEEAERNVKLNNQLRESQEQSVELSNQLRESQERSAELNNSLEEAITRLNKGAVLQKIRERGLVIEYDERVETLVGVTNAFQSQLASTGENILEFIVRNNNVLKEIETVTANAQKIQNQTLKIGDLSNEETILVINVVFRSRGIELSEDDCRKMFIKAATTYSSKKISHSNNHEKRMEGEV